ncbi:putative 3-hydroxyacyl-CoA dehydrogenase, Isomerase, Enoyl-CoA hydratase [Helianthus annuus]|nr:putative 3-hydroxyacyl-CoA dehydrogenase, Isomerase, Enoyl-CoA hydratase [Helianthus annuus]
MIAFFFFVDIHRLKKLTKMAEATVTMEVGSDGVALIAISNPPVNALALPILAGLKEKLAEAMRRDDVKAIVLTGFGKPNKESD